MPTPPMSGSYAGPVVDRVRPAPAGVLPAHVQGLRDLRVARTGPPGGEYLPFDLLADRGPPGAQGLQAGQMDIQRGTFTTGPTHLSAQPVDQRGLS